MTTVIALHLVDHDRIDVHRDGCRDVARTIARGERRFNDRAETLGFFEVEEQDAEQVLRDQLLEAVDPDDLGWREVTDVRYMACLR